MIYISSFENVLYSYYVVVNTKPLANIFFTFSISYSLCSSRSSVCCCAILTNLIWTTGSSSFIVRLCVLYKFIFSSTTLGLLLLGLNAIYLIKLKANPPWNKFSFIRHFSFSSQNKPDKGSNQVYCVSTEQEKVDASMCQTTKCL